MASTKQDRQSAVKKALANGALEGSQPDPEFRKLLDQYVDGEVTGEQAIELVKAKFKQNKPGTDS